MSNDWILGAGTIWHRGVKAIPIYRDIREGVDVLCVRAIVSNHTCTVDPADGPTGSPSTFVTCAECVRRLAEAE